MKTPYPYLVRNHQGPKASGKRVKRGLYQSAAEASGHVSLRGTVPEASDGSLINADLNGAANILRMRKCKHEVRLGPN